MAHNIQLFTIIYMCRVMYTGVVVVVGGRPRRPGCSEVPRWCGRQERVVGEVSVGARGAVPPVLKVRVCSVVGGCCRGGGRWCGAWWWRRRMATMGGSAACFPVAWGRLSGHNTAGPLVGTRGTRRSKLGRLAVRGVLGAAVAHQRYRGDRLSVRGDTGPRGGTRSTSSRVGRGSERASAAQSLGAPAGGARASCVFVEQGGGL